MKVRNKVIVVTGAGSGMGRELALELVRRGASVAAVDMRAAPLAETAKLVTARGGRISTHPLNITDAKAVAELPAAVTQALGQADGLVNNAGIIQPFVTINELDIADAERVMNVNFYGPLRLVKAFLPGLLARDEAHILNVSSMGAYAPVPGQSIYGASKAAVKLMTEGLRSELLETNVGVTIVFPGATATNIAQNSGMSVPAAGSTEASKFPQLAADVAARKMVDAIENNTPRITTGRDAKTLDILSRLNPVWAAGIIYKQMKSLLG